MHRANAYNETDLFKLIAAGDELAFRQVFDAYHSRLAVFIFRLTKSESVAAELVQDIFVKLWVNRGKLGNVSHPQAYIFTMASNRTMDHLRKMSTESKFRADAWKQIAFSHNNTDENIMARESQQLIDRAVVQLSPQKQKIFRLSRYEGLNHEEIAMHLQLSKSTVKNHLVETLRHIRSFIHHHSETFSTLAGFLIVRWLF